MLGFFGPFVAYLVVFGLYLAITMRKISKKIKLKNSNFFSASLFYQPSLNEFSSDYKVSALMALNIPLSEKILFEIQVSSALDNDPPDISKKSNHSFTTNFRYVF